MSHSKVEVYVHFAWATSCRRSTLVPELEPVIYRKLDEVCCELRCPVLAIGGVADHVHLLCRLRSTVTIARLANRLKSVSSLAATHCGFPHFAWQHGYGAFSVSPRLVEIARRYVVRQKIHHARGAILADYEVFEGSEEDEVA